MVVSFIVQELQSFKQLLTICLLKIVELKQEVGDYFTLETQK